MSCTCWQWHNIPVTVQCAKPCFFFRLRAHIWVVTGLISTAQAPRILLFLKSSAGSKGMKPFPFSSLIHANVAVCQF